MTSLAKRKTRLSVEFSDEVREQGKHRPVIMDFHPYGIRVRLKGLHTSYEVTPAGIYDRAVQAHVDKLRAERKARRHG